MIANDPEKFSGNSSICILSQENRISCCNINRNVTVLAEHGLWQRLEDGENWKRVVNLSNINCISNLAEPLIKVLSYYSERVPFSKIEASEELICWKFEGADRNYSEWISSELQMNLEKFIGHLPLKVILLFLIVF